MLRLSVLCLTALLLAGCDSAASDLDDANDFSLRLSGAIQSDFRGDEVESRSFARLHTRPNGGQELTVQLAARRNADMEEISQVHVQYASAGEITPGIYHIADFDDQDFETGNGARARVNYQFESPDLSSRYSAEGRQMVLEIVRVDANYVSGRLRIRSGDVSGYRTLYGQTEEVTLAHSVDVDATFEVEVVP